MPKPQTLNSQKYYDAKLETEAKAIRRQHNQQTKKTFLALTAVFAILAVCVYLLCVDLNFVPSSIDYMRANGILSY